MNKCCSLHIQLIIKPDIIPLESGDCRISYRSNQSYTIQKKLFSANDVMLLGNSNKVSGFFFSNKIKLCLFIHVTVHDFIQFASEWAVELTLGQIIPY